MSTQPAWFPVTRRKQGVLKAVCWCGRKFSDTAFYLMCVCCVVHFSVCWNKDVHLCVCMNV